MKRKKFLCVNKHKVKSGSDEIRVKRINDYDEERFITAIEGTIYDVGIDFVTLQQDDDTVITVLTDRIRKIKWLDKTCKRICVSCRQHHCKCIDKNDHCPRCHRKHCNCRKCDCHADHHNHCEHCGHHHHNSHHDCREEKHTCFCDHVIPFCDRRIELRLAGLHNTVNFELSRHKGCKVHLEIS